jgi:fatty acid-binding protein DegV
MQHGSMESKEAKGKRNKQFRAVVLDSMCSMVAVGQLQEDASRVLQVGCHVLSVVLRLD